MLHWIIIYMYFAALICSVSKADEDKIRVFNTDESRTDFTNLLSSLVKLNEQRINVINRMNRLQDYGAFRNLLRTSDKSRKKHHKNRNLLIIVVSNSKTSQARRRVSTVDSVGSYYDNVEQNEYPAPRRRQSRRVPFAKQYLMTRQHPNLNMYKYTFTPKHKDVDQPLNDQNVYEESDFYEKHPNRQIQRKKVRKTTSRFRINEIQFSERDSLSDEYPLNEKASMTYYKTKRVTPNPNKMQPIEIKDYADDKSFEKTNNNYIQHITKARIKHNLLIPGNINGVYGNQGNDFYKPNNNHVTYLAPTYSIVVDKPQDYTATPEPVHKFDEHGLRLTEQLKKQPNFQLPVTNLPVYQLPVTNLPVYQLPVTNMPLYQLPVTNSPVTNFPVTNIPVTPFSVIQSQDKMHNIPGLNGAHRFSVQPYTENQLPINYSNMPKQVNFSLKDVAAIASQAMLQITLPPGQFKDYQLSETGMVEKFEKIGVRQGTTVAVPLITLSNKIELPKQNVLKIEMGLNDKRETKNKPIYTDLGKEVSEYVINIGDSHDKQKQEESKMDSSTTDFHITESDDDSGKNEDNEALKDALRQNTEYRKSWQKCVGKKAFKKCKKACFSAYKTVCRQLKCTSKSKKDLKKECIRSCKKGFNKSKSNKDKDSRSSKGSGGSGGSSGSGSD